MAETRSITILIDPTIDDELAELARATGRDKQSLAREALVDWLEDREDIRDALDAIARGERPLSLIEVRREFGLAN